MDIFLVLILSALLLMVASFFFLFFAVIAYLILVSKLIEQIKENDNELWESLGKPTFIPFLHSSCNPIQGFIAQLKLCRWLSKKESGIKHEETMKAYKKTKKMLKTTLIVFVSIFIIYAACFIVMLCLPKQPVRQKIQYKGYCFVITGGSESEVAEGLDIIVYENDEKVMPKCSLGCRPHSVDDFKINISEPLPGIVILTEKTFPHIIYFMFDLKKNKRVPFYIAAPAEINPEYQAILKKLNSKITVKNKKFINIETVPGDTGVKIR